MTSRAFSAEARNNTIAALRRVLVVALIGVVLGLTPCISGLVGALILATVLRAPYARLTRVCSRRVAALNVAIAALALLVIPGVWLVSTVIVEATAALRNWSAASTIAWLSRTPLGKLDLANAIANAESTVLGWISGRATAFVGGAMHTGLNLMIAVFGLYYLLLDGPALWERARRLVPGSRKMTDLLASRCAEVTKALLLGTAVSVTLQGCLIGVAFAALGLRPAALWGFVTACAAIVPGVGSALVWAPATALLFARHQPIAATLLGCYGILIVSNLDNLVRPIIFRRVSGVHPMLTLVGAFAGVRLFGIMGAFIGPLVLSYVVELIRLYEDATSIAGTVPVPVASHVSP